MRQRVAVLSLVVLGGCTDFASPAELSRPQILAVRADPPVLTPGQSAQLGVLVAGPAGRIVPAEERWSDGVVVDANGAWYSAPADVELDTFATVSVEVVLADGSSLRATKVIVFAAASLANPSIESVLVAGQAVSLPDPVVLPRGELVDLDLTVAPAPSPYAIYAWYANVGTIDLYRHAPTTLATPADAASGQLFVVYRDGPGVDWREVALEVP